MENKNLLIERLSTSAKCLRLIRKASKKGVSLTTTEAAQCILTII